MVDGQYPGLVCFLSFFRPVPEIQTVLPMDAARYFQFAPEKFFRFIRDRDDKGIYRPIAIDLFLRPDGSFKIQIFPAGTSEFLHLFYAAGPGIAAYSLFYLPGLLGFWILQNPAVHGPG
jgi:hypothetical protein